MISRSNMIFFGLLLSLSGAGIIYFLSLIFHLPFVVAVCVWLLSVIGLYRLFFEKETELSQKDISFATLFVLVVGLALLVNRGFHLSEKYGQWDAWAIWNLHAKFLFYPESWENLFAPGVSPHPDYPLNLPLINAFIWRIVGSQSFLVPFAIASLVTLLIPVISFLQLCLRNLWIAAAVLIWYATDDFYIERGLSQYADSLLSLLFFCSFICADYYNNTGKKKYLRLTGVFLGLGAWTKNEGIMLAGIFSICYLPVWIKKDRWLHILLGAAISLLALLIFKLGFAPANDLVSRQSKTLDFITNAERYSIIRNALQQITDKYFSTQQNLLWICGTLYLLRNQWLDRQMMILLLCFLGFMTVYLLTPMPLEWHLNTSLDRVLLQLSPAFIYVAGKILSNWFYDLSGDR